MLSSVKNIFKVPDLRKKILFTLAMVALYRFGANLPVPGIDRVQRQLMAQWRRRALIEQDVHLRGAQSATCRRLEYRPYLRQRDGKRRLPVNRQALFARLGGQSLPRLGLKQFREGQPP